MVSAFLAALLACSPPPLAASVESRAPSLPVSAVSAHPAIDILNQMLKQGVTLPQGAATLRDAQRMQQAAEALPQGTARQALLGLVDSIQSKGGAAPAGLQAEQLSRTFDAAALRPQPSGVWAALARTRLPLPAFVRQFSADRAYKPLPPPPPPVTVEQLELKASEVRWSPPPEKLPASTADIPPGETRIVGQDRALKAISFGLKMPGDDYNLFISGPDGSGRETAVRHLIGSIAEKMPTPSDLVAGTNFARPEKPVVLELPPGRGVVLAQAFEGFLKTYAARLPQALKSPKTLEKIKAIKDAITAERDAKRKQLFAEIDEQRLPGGKFGLDIQFQDTENGFTHQVLITYPRDGRMETIHGEEEFEQRVAGGSFTREEWEQAGKAVDGAARPFVEKFEAILNEYLEAAAAAQGEIAAVKRSAAAEVANELGVSLLAAVTKNRHDTPAHKAYEERARQRRAAFDAEAAKPSLAGKYGFTLGRADGQLMVSVVEIVDGKPKGVSMSRKLAAGEFTMEQFKAALEPVLKRLDAMEEENRRDHASVHVNDEPLSPSERKAAEWVASLLTHAVGDFDVFLPRHDDQNAVDPEEAFKLSVLVDNAQTQGAPVVWEKNPTFDNLFGVAKGGKRMLVVPGIGAMESNTPGGPTLRAGSFVRARGGFLILDAMAVLQQPGAWQGLIQALETGEAEIVDGGLAGVAQMSGDRHPVAAKVKVVLIGAPALHMLLAEHEQGFINHFRAAAEFEPELSIARESVDETIAGFLRFFRQVIDKSAGQLLEMSRDGIAAVLEHAAELADSNQRVTAQFYEIQELMRMASQWARDAGRSVIERQDVDTALNAQGDALGMAQRQSFEGLSSGRKLIYTSGSRVGEVNGMAVAMGAGAMFGSPIRVTARVSPASELVVTSSDLEAGTVGESYKKSFADVKAYLAALFADRPLKARINISFAQTHGLDGDSATTTMIYAALSALAGIPVNQGFAVTGSSDQLGNAQVIGGVNHKIAGFYDLAAYRGLAGLQGTILPAKNVGDLMLRRDIQQSVEDKKFHVVPVSSVEQGTEILTGASFQAIWEKAAERWGRAGRQ